MGEFTYVQYFGLSTKTALGKVHFVRSSARLRRTYMHTTHRSSEHVVVHHNVPTAAAAANCFS